MSLTTYTQENIKNTKQFIKALSTVFGSIKERNNQIQQLLILATCEAAKVSEEGIVSNNLDWLTNVLVIAETTKGINLSKMVRYVKEELCCNTVSWNNEKSRLAKVTSKDVKLKYNIAPEQTWFEYGKKETVAKAFDYAKRVTSAVNSAMNQEKGGLTLPEIMQAVIASDSVTIDDLMQAIEAINPLQEAA